MYYEQLGVGDPIVFLHSAYSRGILAFGCQLLDFQRHYTCYFPDFRGHGRTRCESLEWSMPQIADDILAFMDALGIARAHFVGYSLGAGAALYCATRRPDRIATLTTIGVSASPTPAGADDYEPEALIAHGQQEIIDQMIARHAEAHRGNWQEFARQTTRDWRRYPALTAEQLAAIACPALFIAGEHDEFASEEQQRTLCAHVRGSRYLIVPGCDHRPHMLSGQPVFVNREILAFLREHPLTG